MKAVYKQNKPVIRSKKAYEVFWQTDYLIHINKNLVASKVKHLDFREIQDNLPTADFVDFGSHFLGFFKVQGKLFEVVCYFETVKKHNRCIVKTAYLTTDMNKVKFIKTAKI